MKPPKNDLRYEWTQHAWMKMQYYGMSEGRIKRIIRFPARIEEGIADDTVAVMQPADSKNYQELWVMYTLVEGDRRAISKNKEKIERNLHEILGKSGKKFRIITAWRYPGKSPERNPIPDEILMEVKSIL
jgi:hypothetical protein